MGLLVNFYAVSNFYIHNDKYLLIVSAKILLFIDN